MATLKKTHLEHLNNETFKLFLKITESPEIRLLNELFKSSGFEIRMAGGAVRDILCNIHPNDIDFASDAKPDEMIQMLSDKPEIRLITTVSGIKHGTVTARINNKSQYEITTLRIDAKTDGRHAQVEFTNDWKVDASRRDLTINSMFIDSQGYLYDYFQGESDLKNSRIRFVGDPAKRIQEDYLRIFRYFRFHARFGQVGQHDDKTISIIKDNMSGLENISGERIWSEMKRILSNINCKDCVEVMFNELNIGQYMGFLNGHHSKNLNEFHSIQQRLTTYSDVIWKATTLFASLIDNLDELSSIMTRLKLSNLERDIITYIISNRHLSTNYEDGIHMFHKQLALCPKSDQDNLRNLIVQFLIYQGRPLPVIQQFQKWKIPEFPIKSSMIANKVKKKTEFGFVLNRLKTIWVEQNFHLDQQQFQEELEKILKELHPNST